MGSFEFVFSLFGLLLGFALVEVLSGLARATRDWRRDRNWFLTTGLGLLVCLDLMTFWKVLYDLQTLIPANVLSLYFGFAVMGVYYWAASMIFPAAGDPVADLDDHYFAVRRKVIGAVIGCNLAVYAMVSFLFGAPLWQLGPEGMSGTREIAWFLSLSVALMLVRSKRASAALLSAILISYIASAVLRS